MAVEIKSGTNYYLGLGERPSFEKRFLVKKDDPNAPKADNVSPVDLPKLPSEEPKSIQAENLKIKELKKEEARKRGTTLDFMEQQGNNMLAFHSIKNQEKAKDEEQKPIIQQQTA